MACQIRNANPREYQESGTIFHGSRKPLTLWFRAIWHITTQKYGANALGLKRMLRLGCYNTAWQWLHKFRRAMVRPDRDSLSGIVEVDETYVGGKKTGKRGRGADEKMIEMVAVEDKGDAGIGRIRLRYVFDASAEISHSLITLKTAVEYPITNNQIQYPREKLQIVLLLLLIFYQY